MAENLLTPSGIKLYGRVVTDILTWQAAKATATAIGGDAAKWDVIFPPPVYPGLGNNMFLQKQLAAVDGAGKPTATLARIYAFSFEGHFYDLPKPAIFLVHNPGAAIKFPGHSRSDVDSSGVVAKEWDFSDEPLMWEYDKGDFSIRLDIESGPFEQILLAAALRGGASPYSSGADLRTSGADLRSSGADLRSSGADLRMSGADLRRR